VDDHREARPHKRMSAAAFRRSPGQPPTPAWRRARRWLRGELL